MNKLKIIALREKPELKEIMAKWFHEKWQVPESSYLESMDSCLKGMESVPQWYVAMDGNEIVGGIGIIENDFHDRKDLTPNVCALYVEKNYRHNGIAGNLLNYVCEDMRGKGVDTLYLITDHTSFYERYGWEFLCMVQSVGESHMTRMYLHQ